jgi:hypothetical protein
MAVQPWELVEQEERPELHLVEAPPVGPSGRPLLAALLVLCMGLALAAPSIATLTRPDEPMLTARRPLAVTSIASLDRLPPMTRSGFPMSKEPVVGFAFVRCTRLWLALPDGTHERRILTMEGIASPAFAPSARTIAFIKRTDSGSELWAAAGDGSEVRRIGSITGPGVTPRVQVTGLAWSADGKKLAFALVDPFYDEFTGGSAIWTLDLATGRFKSMGAGWPAPFFSGENLVAAVMDGLHTAPMFQSTPRRREAKQFRSARDTAAGTTQYGWNGIYRHNVAILREDGTNLKLSIRNSWMNKNRLSVDAPDGYEFFEHARPVVAQDASHVAVDLVDETGERDLGLVDAVTGKWTVLDYAWEAASSPAPVVTGGLDARRVANAAHDVMGQIRRPGRMIELLSGQRGGNVLAFEQMGYTLSKPEKTEDSWTVAGVSFGRVEKRHAYQHVSVTVTTKAGRLIARPEAVGPTEQIDSIADAVSFVEAALGRDVPDPRGLPTGSVVDQSRWSLTSWSWGRDTYAQFAVKAPITGSRGNRKIEQLTFGFGSTVDFSLGCGGENDPEETTLGSTPAMTDHSGGRNQVIWPATFEDRRATSTVFGSVPKEVVVDIARAMTD